MLYLDTDDGEHPVLQPILAMAVRDGVPNKHLCKVRGTWYVLESMSVPDILISPMSKAHFRVVTNIVGAIPTNTLYGIRLRNRASFRKKAEAIASWLRTESGQDALKSVARSHGDGLLKLEPNALKLMRVPKDLIS
jgi:hypothetical protein